MSGNSLNISNGNRYILTNNGSEAENGGTPCVIVHEVIDDS